MAERSARIHTNKSNRVKVEDTSARKVVYRSVLDNPFQVKWPIVSSSIQDTVLARVLSALDGVRDFKVERYKGRKRKRSGHDSSDAHKKSKSEEAVDKYGRTEADGNTSIGSSSNTQTLVSTSHIAETGIGNKGNNTHDILDHITIGINHVAKNLETLARNFRQVVTPEQYRDEEQPEHHGQIVLVCQADIDPPAIVQHLPQLVAACNSSSRALQKRRDQIVWLVPLAKGAENLLSEALFLRRVSVLSIKSSAPQFHELLELIEGIQVLTAAWLNPQPSSIIQRLVPTHIKQIRTTAPKDMKMAKENRAKEKAAAKDRRRERMSKIPKRLVMEVRPLSSPT